MQVCVRECAFGAVRQIQICPIPKLRTEIGLSLSIFSDYNYLDMIDPLALVLAVMSAQFFLYVFACIYERICACRTVSVRQTRTAVREWAC